MTVGSASAAEGIDYRRDSESTLESVDSSSFVPRDCRRMIPSSPSYPRQIRDQ